VGSCGIAVAKYKYLTFTIIYNNFKKANKTKRANFLLKKGEIR